MPVFESSRKVLALGNSSIITLPAMFVKANELEKGHRLKVHYDLNGVLVTSKNDEPGVIVDSLQQIINKLKEKSGKNVPRK